MKSLTESLSIKYVGSKGQGSQTTTLYQANMLHPNVYGTELTEVCKLI